MSADVQKLREKLAWVRKFIEYARYELQPGEQQFGDQFPRQDAADKAMAEIDTVIAALAVLGDPPVAEQEKESDPWFSNLTVAVRDLVALHANRKTRAHLLAAIDEAERRLRASTSPPASASSVLVEGEDK
jgi:hypothetical protein